MAPPLKIEDWYFDAIDLMVRHGYSLERACEELDLAVGKAEIQNILRRAGFQRLLWEARHRYFNELATDPNFRKDTAVGKLIALGQKLEENGEYEKAGEIYFKIGKMMGWVGPESTVSVFGELSQKDLDLIRAKVEQGAPKRAN